MTTIAGSIAMGAYDVGIAGGVEHMGNHPMGEGMDPNPRYLAEKIVEQDAQAMGNTAERLHDRFPAITKERADKVAQDLAAVIAAPIGNMRSCGDIACLNIKSMNKGQNVHNNAEIGIMNLQNFIAHTRIIMR
jgi:acetyl-CoA acyltransferase